MICSTPEGIAANAAVQQLINKQGNDPADAQVLAHLEDLGSALHEALRDQYMDMLGEAEDDGENEDKGKSASAPVTAVLVDHYQGAVKNAEMPVVDLRNTLPVRPVKTPQN